ncbi:MAG: hypothetical protein EON54_03590 [Alcaligenaceae bacterium]|nr:MAG: hypothetical protein EON54_03590 [Alcaligenaceae bacterium]
MGRGPSLFDYWDDRHQRDLPQLRLVPIAEAEVDRREHAQPGLPKWGAVVLGAGVGHLDPRDHDLPLAHSDARLLKRSEQILAPGAQQPAILTDRP